MAEYSNLVTTTSGNELIAKVFSMNARINFTRIVSSSAAYELDAVQDLTHLDEIQQSSLISKKEITNDAEIKVQVAFTNAELDAGYYIRTIGLYAEEPDGGEVLYAVAIEKTGNCYIPPYNGSTVSGALVTLIIAVGSTNNISMNVNPVAVATIKDIEEINASISLINNEKALLEARLNNLVLNATGEAEGNAEIIDMRVGFDGKEYPTAGEAMRTQIEGAFKGVTTIINASNYTEILTNMNEAISNRIYAISENPPIMNAPEGVTLSGTLLVFSCRNGAATHAGVLQFFYTTAGVLYMRQKWGTGETWRDWVRINEEIPKSAMHGKTLYSDGDSIAIGTHSWDENHQIPYADQIAELYSMTLTNAAASGTTLAVREGRTDSILERVTANLKGQSAEYIILDGGINDVFNDVPVGVIEDSYTASFDTSTTLGALENLCALLMRRYPDSKKLFILVHRISGWYSKQNALFDKMILVLEKWGIPYIDMRKESELFALNDTLNGKFFYESDGVHPLTETYKVHYVPKICNKLVSM